jgi:hypothetical protein
MVLGDLLVLVIMVAPVLLTVALPFRPPLRPSGAAH